MLERILIMSHFDIVDIPGKNIAYMCFKKAMLLNSYNIWSPGAFFAHERELFKAKKEGKDITVQEKIIWKCDLRS